MSGPMGAKGEQQQHSAITTKAMPAFLIGRENDFRRLQAAIIKRESRVICGPAGIGKTALVLQVIRSLQPPLSSHCLYVGGFKDLQDLIRQLIGTLYELKDASLRQQLHAEGVTILTFENWLRSLSSSRLKGTLFRTVEQGDYRIFLDHLPPLTHAVAKIIKELFWMRKTPVYLLIYDELAQRLYQFYNFFYWGDRERLTLGPLPAEAATQLLETCIEQFGLTQLDLTDFKEEVLGMSKLIPGAIVKMCSLAANPRYRYGSRVKTKSLYIDYLLEGHNLSFPSTKVDHP